MPNEESYFLPEYRVIYRMDSHPEQSSVTMHDPAVAHHYLDSLWSTMPTNNKPQYARVETRLVTEWEKEIEDE